MNTVNEPQKQSKNLYFPQKDPTIKNWVMNIQINLLQKRIKMTLTQFHCGKFCHNSNILVNQISEMENQIIVIFFFRNYSFCAHKISKYFWIHVKITLD
jgi:hypothetical protein